MGDASAVHCKGYSAHPPSQREVVGRGSGRPLLLLPLLCCKYCSSAFEALASTVPALEESLELQRQSLTEGKSRVGV